MQLIHSLGYDFGYLIGSLWPVLLTMFIVFVCRNDIKKSIVLFLSVKKDLFSMYENKKSRSAEVETIQIHSVFLTKVDWDKYEDPAYIRKNICLNF